MIPGKKYTPEDILALVLRRKWLVILPVLVGAFGSAAYIKVVQARYRSETVIMMTPQRVREDLVRSTVRTTLAERLGVISQQILSRTRLESVITDLNLYQRERRTQVMEDVVERMRKDVDVQLVRGDAFRVSYVADSPLTAMRVTERLGRLFIDENLKDRELTAQGTSQFLESQLEETRHRLEEQEKRLSEYRQLHSGELPTQQQSNLTAIATAQIQIRALQDAIARERDQLQQIDRQVTELTSPETIEAVVDMGAATVTGGTAAQQLEAARNALKALSLRLTPEHPDMARMNRLVATLEQKAEKEALETPLSPDAGTAKPRNKADAARLARIKELQYVSDRSKNTIPQQETEEARLRGQISMYQGRVDASPTRETELLELTRGYSTLQSLYQSLLSKSEESKLAVNLETRQVGQQFRIIDPARLPERPFSPNKERVALMGLAGGLGLGVLLLGFVEYRDTTFKSDQDVVLSLSLPVLALVPVVRTMAEVQRVKNRRRAMAVASLVVLAVGLVGAAWWYVVTQT